MGISRSVLVYSKDKRGVSDLSRKISSFLARYGIGCEITERSELLFKARTAKLETDLLIVLGGDGTLLTGIHALKDVSTLVLGINMGRGGFLCEVGPEDALEAVKRVLEGNYSVEETMTLEVMADGKKLGYVVNEVYIANSTIGKVIEFSLEQGSNEVMKGVADGFIISTPIGSTAYSFSAGGPAVDHRVDAIIATPVNPLSNIKPIVLPASLPVIIKLIKSDEHEILLDGQERFKVRPVNVKVLKSKNVVKFVRILEVDSFVKRLRKRFG